MPITIPKTVPERETVPTEEPRTIPTRRPGVTPNPSQNPKPGHIPNPPCKPYDAGGRGISNLHSG